MARAALTWRFLSSAWAETTAALGIACLVLIAFGVVIGVAYLVGAAEFAGVPRMLTSEFAAQHIAAAFRWPSYLIVIHSGHRSRIGMREQRTSLSRRRSRPCAWSCSAR